MNDKIRTIRSLLEHQTTLVLASVNGAAQPRNTSLFFICDEDLRLYWFSSRSSLHSRNCAHDPRASVAVFRHTEKWEHICGVQLDGLVSVVDSRTLRRDLTQTYRARLRLGDDFGGAIRRCALYCFTPEWARYVDNARGFGYKFELRLGLGLGFKRSVGPILKRVSLH